MDSKYRTAFNKTKKLIEERKSRLGNSIIPDIQNLDSGILLQYFENGTILRIFNAKKLILKLGLLK